MDGFASNQKKMEKGRKGLIITSAFFVLVVLLIKGATFFRVTAPGSSSSRASGEVNRDGYRPTYDGSVRVYRDPSGQALAMSNKFARAIDTDLLTSFLLPFEEENHEVIYFSTTRYENPYAAPLDPCVSQNRIYRYNLATDEQTLIYEEKSTSGSPYDESRCRILRTVGRVGDNLLFLVDDPENSGGPCTNIWVDYSKQFVTLDPNNPDRGTKPLALQPALIDVERKVQVQCFKELPE